eukprot:1150924-Pelagomonas_calceolata.AAC.2
MGSACKPCVVPFLLAWSSDCLPCFLPSLHEAWTAYDCQLNVHVEGGAYCFACCKEQRKGSMLNPPYRGHRLSMNSQALHWPITGLKSYVLANYWANEFCIGRLLG